MCFRVLWILFEPGVAHDIMNNLPVTHSEILHRLGECCPRDSEHFSNFALFIGKISGLDNLTISKDICVSTALFLLEPWKERREVKKPTATSLDYYISLKSNQSNTEELSRLSIEERSKLILNLLKKNKLDENEMHELYNRAVTSPW